MIPTSPRQPHAIPGHATAALDWREQLAIELETSGSAEQRVEMMRSAVIDTGGIWIDPPERGGWGPAYHEISLGGISATGNSRAEAVASWIKAVLRVARAAAEAPA